MPSKLCKTCNKLKPFDDFFKRKAAADGLQYNCKDCQRTRQRLNPSLVDDLSLAQKANVYTDVIIRMRSLGIMSAKTAEEALERVTH